MTQAKALILVADDDDLTRRLVGYILESIGLEVIEASDGAEAINIAHSKRPAVILMDVIMRGMDGYTALGELKKNPQTSGIPVVMLTGIDLEMNRKLAQGLGSSGYLTKPFARQDLLEAVGRFIPVVATQIAAKESQVR